MRTAFTLFAPLALAACVTPGAAHSPALEGSAVPLGKAVEVGALVATPEKVTEDSRCPINARCIWAGRLIVETAIEAKDWSETAQLTLGEPYATHGTTITLSSGEPGQIAGKPTDPKDYRFTFEGGR